MSSPNNPNRGEGPRYSGMVNVLLILERTIFVGGRVCRKCGTNKQTEVAHRPSLYEGLERLKQPEGWQIMGARGVVGRWQSA